MFVSWGITTVVELTSTTGGFHKELIIVQILILALDKNKNKFISEQNMKFDDDEILFLIILLETHTMDIIIPLSHRLPINTV